MQTETVRVGKRTTLRPAVAAGRPSAATKALRELQESTPVPFESAQHRANTLLAKITPSKKEAARFLQEVERRRATGALHEVSYRAEKQKGVAVQKLISTIEQVYAAAVEQEDTSALGRVSATSNVLASILQRSRLLKHETYVHVGDHAETLASQVKTTTRRYFDSVIGHLATAPQDTGVELPSL